VLPLLVLLVLLPLLPLLLLQPARPGRRAKPGCKQQLAAVAVEVTASGPGLWQRLLEKTKGPAKKLLLQQQQGKRCSLLRPSAERTAVLFRPLIVQPKCKPFQCPEALERFSVWLGGCTFACSKVLLLQT